MATTLYLTNLDSDVSGYKLALVNERNPNATSTPATAVTNTSGSGSNIAQTITAGGTTLKFITKPLSVAVTIASIPFYNAWGLESNASANAGLQFRIAQYTGGAEGASLLTDSYGTELSTTPATINQWKAAGGISSTSFAVGDRVVIDPYITNVGTMGGSQTTTMTFDVSTSFVSGDTYVIIQEDLRVQEVQVGSGTVPTIPGVGISYFYDLALRVQNAVSAGLIASNCAAQQIIDEANNSCGLGLNGSGTTPIV
jgi:hypothetical protein